MKIILYQIFTRLYGNRNATRHKNGSIEENGCGKLNDFTPTVLKQLRERGITHVWYTGVIRHATQTDYSQYGIPTQHPAVVKGKAGSPYAIADYYDVDPDLAVNVEKRMEEFERLVNRTHRAGLKMVIDFVPNHVARQYKSIAKPAGVSDLGEGDDTSQGFSPQNNFYYCPGETFAPYFDLYHGEEEPYTESPAKATGNDCFHRSPGRNDWYETVKLNYGVDYYAGRVGHFDPVPDTWKKMLDILLFWADKGVDAFRCDMAEMVPAEFWAWATSQVKAKHPGLLFIGEVYNPGEYRRYIASGFDYLYDKVGMYDVMRDVICHRRGTDAITWAWQVNDDIRPHMLYFLENHDEQRIASDFFAVNGQKAVPALIANVLMFSNPFMFYAGQEYGEKGMDQEGFSGHDGRTTIFDYWSVDTLCRAAQKKLTAEEQALADTYGKVMAIAKEKAVAEGMSYDLMYVNAQHFRQYAFLRKAGSDALLVVVNFDDRPVVIDLRIPAHAFDFMGIGEGEVEAEDLLSGSHQQLALQRDGMVKVSLQKRNGIVLKFKTK
ncbi:MAG: alpha-amylase [Prevotella sp.]|nr:alpha-amylase [Prevotella sp.]